MKKILFSLFAALLTCSSVWAADEVAPTYMFPEGTFFSGYNNKGGLLAPYLYMPASDSYVFTTAESGSWAAGTITSADATSFDAKYEFGYSSNPVPTVTIGGTAYQYGSGSTTSGSKVARVAASSFNLMTSAMAFAAGSSATQVSKIAGVTDYYIYMPNKAGQVMRVKGVSIPITTNNNGTDKTPTALFPDENAHMCVQLFNASFTRNADWTTNKAKGSKELTPKYTATIASFTPNSDTKQYVGSINIEFEEPVDIVGPFVVVLSDFESMGAETRLFCDKAQSNTTQYHKNGSFYKSTSGYLVSVNAMFPGVLNAGKTEFQFTAKDGKETIAFYTNTKPEELNIQLPDWLTYTVAYAEDDKFYTNRQVYLCLKADDNVAESDRNGKIVIDNYGMKLTYNVKQESATYTDYEDFAPFGTATGTWNLVAKGKQLTELPSQVCYLNGDNNIRRVKVSNFNYSTKDVAKDVIIDWNAETNVCTIKQMSTGYNSDGKLTYMATSAAGTYDPETATFTLPMKYYTEEKTLYEKTETFQLDAAVTVSDAGYATTYLPFAVSIPEDVSVFTATINEGTKQVTMNELDAPALPAETAVVIKAEPDTYVFNAAFDVAAVNVANELKGTLVEATATELGEDADNYVYVLNKVDENVGFYHLGGEGSKLAANRAYLLVDKDLVDNNATKVFTFTFDEATGISNVNAVTKTDGKRFSISGQTVGKGYKGIVVINGKKYVE